MRSGRMPDQLHRISAMARRLFIRARENGFLEAVPQRRNSHASLSQID